MVQFEYMTVILNSRDIEDSGNRLAEKLNKYGEHGWELISAISQPGLGSSKYSLIGVTQKNILILKRQLKHNKEMAE